MGPGDLPLLFSPIDVGTFTLRNRLITTGHGAFRPWDPADTGEQFIEYQRRRAAGGLGMMILQPIFVEPEPSWPLMMGERIARLAEAVHAEGARAVLQLVSFGGQMSAAYNLGGRPLWSFNGMQAPGGEIAHRMTADEVDEMVDAFGRAARVATEAGLDGVELHGAHGYLIHQSYSPWGNDRDDEWGDPPAFSRAVIATVRGAVGPDKIVGFRMAEYDERPPEQGGLSVERLREIGRAVVETGSIDYLNTSIGSKAPDYAAIAVASYRTRPGHELELTHAMRAAIGSAVPVVGVGRILTAEQGEQALANGDCDLVAMTRGHIADPDIAVKVRRGDSHRVRRCVGANACNDRKLAGFNIACFHNPDVGREARGPITRTDAPRRVLVAGGGPGGLKAAELAALRGHDVVVLDRAPEAGGALRHVRATAARELFHAVEHLVNELELVGVRLRLATEVNRDLLVSERPDHVIVATGAIRAATTAFTGADRSGVMTSDQALGGDVGQRILVLDRLGVNEGPLVAEALVAAGRQITFATPFESFAPHAGYSHRKDLAVIFRRAGVTVLTDSDVVEYDGSVVTIADPEGAVVAKQEVDSVVAVTAPAPELALVPVLADLAIPYSVIGDAGAPRGVQVAMREADDVARVL